MKVKIVLAITCILVFLDIGNLRAQTYSQDSIINVVITRINDIWSKSFGNISRQDLGDSFYINDIATNKSIIDKGFGIYAFGLCGDDLGGWIMLYDATGFKIFEERLNTNMLGEILEYLNRNNISEKQSFQYIKGLYLYSSFIENVGETEIQQ